MPKNRGIQRGKHLTGQAGFTGLSGFLLFFPFPPARHREPLKRGGRGRKGKRPPVKPA